MSNRRGTTRIHNTFPALCRITQPPFQRASVLDLSEGGARLVLRDQVEVGARLVLNIKLEAQRSISLEVEVVRVQGQEVGVRHIGGSLMDLRFLSAWVHRQSMILSVAA